jgi:membrane protein
VRTVADSAAPRSAASERTSGGPHLRHLAQLFEHGTREFFRDGCTQRAAAIAFYALFSVFPLAILSVAVLGLVVNDQHARNQVVDFLLRNLPLTESQGRAEIEKVLRQATRDVTGLGLLGILTLLFAASGVMGSIRMALNAAFDIREDRPPLQAKARDLVMVLGFGVLVTLSFSLTLADQLRRQASHEANKLISGAGGVVQHVLVDAGRLVPLLLAVVIFALLFKFVPARRVRLRDSWPGVLVAAVGYELAKLGFALYLAHFANYGAVYASLGSVIALLVFVFLAANVALLGAEIASEWPCVRAGDYDNPPDQSFGRRVLGFLRGLALREK